VIQPILQICLRADILHMRAEYGSRLESLGNATRQGSVSAQRLNFITLFVRKRYDKKSRAAYQGLSVRVFPGKARSTRKLLGFIAMYEQR
jgi:hypothetical protein